MIIDLSCSRVKEVLASAEMEKIKDVVSLYKVKRLMSRGYRLYRFKRSWIIELMMMQDDDTRVNAVRQLGMGPLMPCEDPVEAVCTPYYNSIAEEFTILMRLLPHAYSAETDIMHWIMYNECFVMCIFMFRLCTLAWPQKTFKIAVNDCHCFVIDELFNMYDPIVYFVLNARLYMDINHLIDTVNIKTYDTIEDYLTKDMSMNDSDIMYKLIIDAYTN